MKTHIAAAFVGAAIMIGSTAVVADEEMVVTGQAPSKLPNLDQQAVNACMTAFASRVQPAGQTRVRTVVPSNYGEVFSKFDVMDRETAKVMKVEMNAYLAGTDNLLAKSVCTVSINANVLDLSIDKLHTG